MAAKLTDGVIRGVLLSLDAVNRLTRLMLTGCIKITGAGLEPLRGSLVIEHIDLSPMKTSISFYRVLPILDSIIEQERCALKHLEFSRAWRSRQFPSATPFQQFISRYNEMWARRQNLLSCFKCSARLPQRKRRNGQWVHDVGGLWIKRKGSQFGIDRHTCYGCLKHYCRNCESESGGEMLGTTCHKCDRMYCADCAPILKCVPPEINSDDCWKLCSNCAPKEQICRDCGSFCCEAHLEPCESCGFFCHHCSEDDEAAITCESIGCNERLCSGCRSQSGSKGIKYCSRCPENYCNGCRVRHLSAPHLRHHHCMECDSLGKIYLLEEKIEGLTKENKELTDKNKELTDKNEQLRGKMKTMRKIEGKTEQHE